MTQRVIKFRYLWKHDGTGKIVSKEYELSDIQNWLVEYPDHTIRWDIIARLQFTGLTDKHGKEIYEGDILSFDFNPEMAIYGENHDRNPVESDYDRAVYIVQYEDGYRLCGKGIRRNLYLHAFRFQYTKRLGDIYTTPELVDPKMIER